MTNLVNSASTLANTLVPLAKILIINMKTDVLKHAPIPIIKTTIYNSVLNVILNAILVQVVLMKIA